MASVPFRCKKFLVEQEGAVHPVGTDSILLGAWADIEAAQTVLDIGTGTGTGIIALMLAQRIAAASGSDAYQIDAVELHAATAACARHNLAASVWAANMHVIEMSVQQWAATTDVQYDLIVSNPPFFTETVVSPDATRRLGRDTATLTQSDLIAVVQRLLAPKGRFCLILPTTEARRFAEHSVTQGLYWTRELLLTTRSGKPIERVMLQLERNPYPFERTELCIRGAGESFSDTYKSLTGAFYL